MLCKVSPMFSCISFHIESSYSVLMHFAHTFMRETLALICSDFATLDCDFLRVFRERPSFSPSLLLPSNALAEIEVSKVKSKAPGFRWKLSRQIRRNADLGPKDERTSLHSTPLHRITPSLKVSHPSFLDFTTSSIFQRP